MDIQMIGIDHQNASIEEREAFAFTKAQAKRAMEQWKSEHAFSGGLLLSTCNRTELWISGGAAGADQDPAGLLCSVKGVQREPYEKLFIRRGGQDAVLHLLQLICGLKSRIYGEDQILSQIRDALELSRECGSDDMVIEKLFQTAISAGKRVKTQVKIETADPSAARNVQLLIKDQLGEVKGLSCLIIGNGQMGKLVANLLVESGANVTMTLRKKMHGKENRDSIIPEGCHMIDYEQRMEQIETYKVIISATLSPHFTILKENLEGKKLGPSIWIDMAVPRDIDPKIKEIAGIQLYDMDKLGDSHIEARTEQSLRQSMEILETYLEELERWFSFREHIDTVKRISAMTADDAYKRMEKSIIVMMQEETGEIQLQESIGTAVDKAVEKLLFGLRDTLPQDHWETCLTALEKSAARDTLKTGKAK